MALTTGNIVQAAITELQTRLEEKGRAGLTHPQMRFVFGFEEFKDVTPAVMQEIADYFDALAWTSTIRILWAEQKIVLFPAPA